MSRLDKLKQQHPEFNVSIIDIMGKIDPTDTYKYTEFLIKRLKEWFDGKTHEETQLIIGAELIGEDNVTYLNEFENHCKAGRIKKNDIGQHKGFNSIKESVREAEEIQKQKEAEKQVVKLLDNDEYCIVVPLSYEASKVYGSNTKWCTTQERYWNDYQTNYKLIYIIDKVNDEKYAISRKKDDDVKIQGWMADDKEVNPMMLPLPSEVMSLVISEVKKKESVSDLIDEKSTGVIEYETYNQETLKMLSSYVNGEARTNSYLDYNDILKYFGLASGKYFGGSISYDPYNDNVEGDGFGL